MTNSARVDRALRTTNAETSGSSRRSRWMGNDPFILLAVALAIPAVVVNYLDGGPDEVAISLCAVVFIALQAVLSVVWPLGGRNTARNTARNPAPGATRPIPWNDLRALVRLTLALAFVGATTYATADASSLPLAPLFIPVIGLAAAIGTAEAVVILVLAGLACLAAFQYTPVLVASTAEQTLVLAAVSVVLVIGTRQTVASLNAALARLRTMNASERRRNRQIVGLDAVGRTLAADGPEPSSLEAVMDLLIGPFGYSHGSIYLGEALGGSARDLRMGAQHGYDGPIPTFDGTTGVIGRVMRTGEAALVTDVTSDPDYRDAVDGITSEICVPIIGSHELLGILNIESNHGVLDERDLEVIRLVADRLASALTLDRERRRLAERARLFQGVVNFGAAINSSLDGTILNERIVAGLTEVMSADLAALTLLDRHDGSYRLRAFNGGDRAYLGAEIRPGEGTAGRAIRDRAPVVDDAFERRSLPASTADIESPDVMASLAIPLIREHVVIGAITLIRNNPSQHFSELELEMVQMLGTQVALAIANAELHAEVMEASIRDSLTGTFNRRHFEPSLERTIAARRRLPVADRPPLAAIMFDLDEFGAFNKFHGHQTGDAVLRAFGKLLLERFRASDLVARYGGEEFVAILDGTGREDAFRIAEEVRLAFAEQTFRGASGERLSATVSAGCAELGPTDSLRELLGACDVGLAMAKGAGRNQVVAA